MHPRKTHRGLATAVIALLTTLTFCLPVLAADTVEVYKSPTCGCCALWVSHLERAGFKVNTHESADIQNVKDENGVPLQMRSCHTARIGDYVIEGHVPADDIRQMLKRKPAIKGLAVPGMPIGSPGMEVAGHPAARYTVFAFDDKGKTSSFSQH